MLKKLIVILVCIVMTAGISAGCVKQMLEEKVVETIIEKSIEKAAEKDGKEVDVDIDDDKISIKGSDGEVVSIEQTTDWPEDMPEDVPKPEGLTPNSVMSMLGTSWTVAFEEGSINEGKAYVEMLEKKGWNIVAKTETEGLYVVSADMDNLFLMFSSEEDGSVLVVSLTE